MVRACQALRAVELVRSFYRAHRLGQHGGAKALAQPFYGRILLERAARGGELRFRSTPRLRRGGLPARAAGLELEPHRLAKMPRQGLGELLLGGRSAHQLVTRIEREAHDRALPANENAVVRELPGCACELEPTDEGGP